MWVVVGSGVWVVGDGVGLWWLWVFFFGCDRCLKGLWVVVGFGVWVVAEVGCG